jgi:endoribonuclease Dicer
VPLLTTSYPHFYCLNPPDLVAVCTFPHVIHTCVYKQMSQIGILAFDEAHHCASDHPYAQLMEDFYHTSPINSRPQITGLTASPGGF